MPHILQQTADLLALIAEAKPAPRPHTSREFVLTNVQDENAAHAIDNVLKNTINYHIHILNGDLVSTNFCDTQKPQKTEQDYHFNVQYDPQSKDLILTTKADLPARQLAMLLKKAHDEFQNFSRTPKGMLSLLDISLTRVGRKFVEDSLKNLVIVVFEPICRYYQNTSKYAKVIPVFESRDRIISIHSDIYNTTKKNEAFALPKPLEPLAQTFDDLLLNIKRSKTHSVTFACSDNNHDALMNLFFTSLHIVAKSPNFTVIQHTPTQKGDLEYASDAEDPVAINVRASRDAQTQQTTIRWEGDLPINRIKSHNELCAVRLNSEISRVISRVNRQVEFKSSTENNLGFYKLLMAYAEVLGLDSSENIKMDKTGSFKITQSFYTQLTDQMVSRDSGRSTRHEW